MFSQVFLAVTHREIETFCPEKAAYMACHFSAGGKGLSNLPQYLTPGSILLLDDSMPVQGHDKETVVKQIQELAEHFAPKAVLLDFQRPRTEESDAMVSAILQAAPCPVAPPPVYAAARNCPVFLPPPAVNKPLDAHLQPWLARGIFLEIAPETVQFTITNDGCITQPVSWEETLPMDNKRSHCHYRKEEFPEKVVVTVTRSLDDLAALSKEAYDMGVLGTVGLYQELVGNR